MPTASKRQQYVSTNMDLRAQEPVRNKAINKQEFKFSEALGVYVICFVYRTYAMSNVYMTSIIGNSQ